MNTLEGAIDWITRARAPARRGARQAGATRSRTSSRSRTSRTAASRSSPAATAGASSARREPFLDPFYSPGSDYIAMSNTFTTDLVTRELDGEDVAERAEAHNDFYLNAYRVHLTFYEGQYEFWHNPLVMNVEDRRQQHPLLGRPRRCCSSTASSPTSSSWRPCGPDLERIWGVTRALEAMYREWNALESREWRRAMVPTAGVPGDVRAPRRHGRRLRRRDAEGRSSPRPPT